MSDPARRVVVEADGGARGNPGPAAFGALVRDRDTGRVLAETAETIGTASNNVAEYRGLIAGLELVDVHAPGAAVEVRMDSKLVIEQMAGRWKVKHPDMKALALRARRLAPEGTVWTWVPRAENAAADRLVNAVLDGERAEGARVVDDVERAAEDAALAAAAGSTVPDGGAADGEFAGGEVAGGEVAGGEVAGGEVAGGEAAGGTGSKGDPLVGWRDRMQTVPTTVVLLRHGATASTEAKQFCGRGGSDPGLTERGHEQAQRAAGWLARRGAGGAGLEGVGRVDVIVSSPLRRCRETAQAAADALQMPVTVVDDFAEAAFGDWDGLSFAEVQQRWPDLLTSWLGDETVRPPGGETPREVGVRVGRALRLVLAEFRDRTVLLVSHVTPIKSIVRETLDAPPQLMHRLQLAPASLTVAQWWPDGVAVLRTFSYEPE
ncbi:bifunctional RNase H/acid phosphatase [soil metagenome]